MYFKQFQYISIFILFTLLYCNLITCKSQTKSKINLNTIKKITYEEVIIEEGISDTNYSIYSDLKWNNLKFENEFKLNKNDSVSYPFLININKNKSSEIVLYFSSKKKVNLEIVEGKNFYYYIFKKWNNRYRDTVLLFNVFINNKRFQFERVQKNINNLENIEIYNYLIVDTCINYNKLYTNFIGIKNNLNFNSLFSISNNNPIGNLNMKNIDCLNKYFLEVKENKLFELNSLSINYDAYPPTYDSSSIEKLIFSRNTCKSKNSIFFTKTYWDKEVYPD